jgi:hypothetical protein
MLPLGRFMYNSKLTAPFKMLHKSFITHYARKAYQ